MAYTLSEMHLRSAFRGEPVAMYDFQVDTSVLALGELCITSGRILASDPFVVPDAEPFTLEVPNGMHAVAVAISHAPEGDQRIAYARVRFTDADAVRWEMARTAGQRVDNLDDDAFVGYGVDSGSGCFADPVAGQLLAGRFERDKKYFKTITQEMKANYVHTRDWANVKPAADRPENVILFTAGLGDGSYPSFFGFDAGGRLAQLVTDFGVLVVHDEPQGGTGKPWWKFW